MKIKRIFRKKNSNFVLISVMCLIMALGSIMIISENTNFENNDDQNTSESDFKLNFDSVNNLIASATQIEIDEDDPVKNWTITAAAEDWCSGSGTWSDPYKIQDETFYGDLSNPALWIDNSENVYFEIFNCTFINEDGTSDSNDIGIKITNSQNGTIHNCTFMNNEYSISADYINNITISDNYVNNSLSYGFYINHSDNVTISDTLMANTTGFGIYLYNSEEITILDNNITSTTNSMVFGSGYAITIKTCSNNTISQNILFENSKGGIKITDSSENNTIVQNYIYDQTERGVWLSSVDNNTIISNTISQSLDSAVYLDGSESSLIENNTFFENKYGLLLASAYYNEIINNSIANSTDSGLRSTYNAYANEFSNNTIVNSTSYGIYFSSSNQNTFSGNHINSTTNGRGIFLLASNYNIFNQNVVCNNSKEGIEFDNNSKNNTLSNGNISGNNDEGILIDWSSDSNIIRSNQINYNAMDGLEINYGKYSLIENNTIISNGFHGIVVKSTSGNQIQGNTIQGHIDGIYINAASPNIENNTITDCSDASIMLYGSSSNLIITGNNLSNSYYGVSVTSNCDNVTISYNEITRNSISGFYGTSLENLQLIHNNITLSGQKGVDLSSSTNCTISYNNITNNDRYNLYLLTTTNSIISYNNISGAIDVYGEGYGVYASQCSYLTFFKNNVSYNERYGFNFIASTGNHHNVINGNTISFNQNDGIVINDGEGYNNCSNNWFIENSGNAIFMMDLEGQNNITNNNFMDSRDDAIYILRGTGDFEILIYNNVINQSDDAAIYIYSANNVNISHNIIIDALEGIYLAQGSHNNTINQNIIDSATKGLCLHGSVSSPVEHQNFTQNTLSNCDTNLYFEYATENLFWNNTFNDYGITQIESSNSDSNIFSYNSLGNNWSDYVGTDLNDDGFGDTAYSTTGITDNYPIYEDGPNLAPEFTSIPNDAEYGFGASGKIISWTVSDDDIFDGNYWILRNDSIIVSGFEWTNGVAITQSLDGLSSGIFNFTIFVNDGINANISDTVWITISANQPPSFSDTPSSSIVYTYGTTGSLSWTIEDPDIIDANYWIFHNNEEIISAQIWTDSNPILQSINGFGEGLHNITIKANDGAGENISHTVMLTINAYPEFTQAPADEIAFNDETGTYTLTWTINDDTTSTPTYWLLKDGSHFSSGLWTSDSSFGIDIAPLDKGVYNFTLQISDGMGLNISDQVNITVNGIPEFTQTPTNEISFIEETESYTLTWVIDDDTTSSPTYWLLKDGTHFSAGIWTSEIDLEVDIAPLDEGVYNFTLQISDGLGYNISDQVNITVNGIPEFSQKPEDEILFEEETASYTLTWTINDDTTSSPTYWLLKDGIHFSSGSWTSYSAFGIDIAPLDEGVYNFTLQISDGMGINISNQVNITVNGIPEFSQKPEDEILFEEETASYTLTWTINDDTTSSPTYWLLKDGIHFSSGSWTSDSAFGIDIAPLDEGVYNFTLQISDGMGRNISNQVNITVNGIPEFTQKPADELSFEEITTTYTLTWKINDDTTATSTYWLLKDGTHFSLGSWTSETALEIDVAPLDPGRYNFTLQICDGLGYNITDQVNITVYDVPVLENPPLDFGYEYESTNNMIQWIVSDDNVENPTYTLLHNSWSFGEPGLWSDGNVISINIDGLTRGYHNFTIFIDDGTGGTLTDTINITVFDNPIFYTSLEDFAFEVGTENKDVYWDVGDSHIIDPIYTITQNGVPIVIDQTWGSSDNIRVHLSEKNLEIGIYIFEITIQDGYGGVSQDAVMVTVYDNPTINVRPEDGTIYTGDSDNQISWCFNDESTNNSYYRILRNGIEIIGPTQCNSETPIDIDLDGLDPGEYNFTIIIEDGYGGSAQDTVMMSVKPQIVKTWWIYALSIIVVGFASFVVIKKQKEHRETEDITPKSSENAEKS